MDTGGLSVSWAQRRNERGKVVRYISVAGERSKIDTLDSKKEFLKTRGWRLAQEQDGQNGQGNGMGGWGHKHAANNAPAPMNTPPRRNWRQADGRLLTAREFQIRWRN